MAYVFLMLTVSIKWRKPRDSMKEQYKKGGQMKHKKLKLCVIFLLGLGLTGLQAQTCVNATGGNASGSEGSASYSVGQVAYQTHTGTSGSMSEGVQQPYEISIVTGLEGVKGINLSVSAYPNPTTDYLTLEVQEFELSNLHFQLYDMNGKLLQSEKITGNQTSIVMINLVSATYFVKVYTVGGNDHTVVIQNNKEVKSFKIIKN